MPSRTPSLERYRARHTRAHEHTRFVGEAIVYFEGCALSLSLSLSFCVWCTTCQAHGMGGWLEPGLVFVTRGRGSWGFVTRGGGCYWFVKGCDPLPSCTGRSYQGPWVNIVRHPFAPWASCFVSFRSQVRAGHGPWRHAST